eukprot:XP_011683434.1 PREDICTED: uncharacterized protein LOC584063 [Strongylocentrotus purpuratus]
MEFNSFEGTMLGCDAGVICIVKFRGSLVEGMSAVYMCRVLAPGRHPGGDRFSVPPSAPLPIQFDKEASTLRGEAGPEPMDIFLAPFMRQKYPEEKLAFEWTYMLLSVLEENEKDNHLTLFHKILIGEMDEDVYHHQFEVLSDLMAAFKKADEEEGGHGSFNKDILEHALREFFPIKDDDAIQALVDAAVQELESEDETKLLYEELFQEEEDGTVGPFISLLRSQEQEEKLQYVDDIRLELEGKEEIPWREVQMAINVIDAEIDRPHMVQYVCRAFDVPQDQITTAQPTTLDVIVRRLQKSTVRRIGKLNSSELT